MRRWYTTFPHGWAGVGLFLLRAAIGGRLLILAFDSLGYADTFNARAPKWEFWLLGYLALAMGVSFVLGILTPLAACVTTLGGAALYLLRSVWAYSFPELLSFEAIVVMVAIAMLGPGALSVDAYLFGRRRIVIARTAKR